MFLINFSIFFYLSCVRTHGIWQSITSCGTRGTVLCEKTHELERLYCFLKTCYIFSTDYSIHIRNRTEKVELLSAISNNIALQGKELAGLFQVWMYSSIWRVSDIYNTTRWPLCSVDQLIMWPSKEVIQYYSIWHWIVNGSRRLSVGCEDYLQACIYLLLPVIQRSIAHLFPIWLHFSWPHTYARCKRYQLQEVDIKERNSFIVAMNIFNWNLPLQIQHRQGWNLLSRKA